MGYYNQGGIECIDAMLSAFGEEAVKDFCLLNAFKYLWRCRDKNGTQDLEKAKWYIEKIITLSSSCGATEETAERESFRCDDCRYKIGDNCVSQVPCVNFCQWRKIEGVGE